MSPARFPRRHLVTLIVSFAILACAWTASWAENENETVGFKPNHIFEASDSGENIDLLNGGMTLSIPIGMNYPVSRNLSYQLSLNYSSRIWDTSEESLWHQSWLYRRGPVGVGFSLNFGRFYRDVQRRPSTTLGTQNIYVWKWMSPDGTEHEFGAFAQEKTSGINRPPLTSTYDGSGCGASFSQSMGTWDGTGLAPIVKIVCGDGVQYTFEHFIQVYEGPGIADPFNSSQPVNSNSPYEPLRRKYNQDFGGWYVTLIEDTKTPLIQNQQVRSGWVRIAYDTTPGFEHVIKTITDSVGRQIDFTNECVETNGVCAPDAFDLDSTKPRLMARTKMVTVPAFGHSTSVQPSETATYTFEYSRDSVDNLVDHYPGTTTETFLRAIQFPSTQTPANTSPDPYRMSFDYDLTLAPRTGELTGRTLPTGARIGYLWESYGWASPSPGYFGVVGGVLGGFTRALSEKTLDLDPTAGTFDGDWRYTRESSGIQSNPSKVTVLDIAGNETVHYFHASQVTSRMDALVDGPTDGYAPEWDDGLNYKTEFYQGHGAGRQLIRTTATVFQGDDGSCCLGNPYRMDIRASRETTFLDDDQRKSATVEYSEYVAGGLHRLKRESGSGIAHDRWTRTQYIGTDPSIFDFQELYDDERIYSRRDMVHSALDGTSGRRIVQEIDRLTLPGAPGMSNLALQPGDVTAIYAYDVAGNVSEKHLSDGDSADDYRFKYGFTSGGQIASKEFYLKGSSTLLFGWKAIDRTRDANTGLIMESRDPAGLATQYDYDALGRLVKITPPGSEHPTEIIYEQHAAGGVVTSRRTVVRQGSSAAMGSTTSCAPSPGDYVMTCYEYDSLGRMVRIERRPESSSTEMAYQIKTYDLQGHATFESKWLLSPSETCNPADPENTCGTSYDFHDPGHPADLDPFGRVRRVRTADGKESTTDYFGLSSSVTVHGIATETSPLDATTTYYRDVWGRLVYVDVPAGGGSDAAYVYDARDNLIAVQMEDTTGVNQTIQNRAFEYDALNRLRSSWNPESNGSTVVRFDALGNVLDKRDSTGNHILSTFDGAGRLITVSHQPFERPTSEPAIEVVHNYFDQIDTSGHTFGASAGRLTKTESFDDDHSLTLTKEFQYSATTSRLAEERSYIPGWNIAAPLKYQYGPFGLVTRMDYPEGSVGKGGAFGVTYTYSNGYLKEMRDAVTTSTMYGTANYNPAGGYMEITTLGNVKTAIEPDEMQRTKSITVSRTSGGTTTNYLATGNYVYDGAGNIASIGPTTGDRSSYAYDAANRLVLASIWSGGSNRVQTYQYDDFGNMVDKRETVDLGTAHQDVFGQAGINRTVSHLERLGQTAIANNLFAYDARGNLVRSDNLIHEYDARDRMVSVRGVGADFVARYSYDASAYRIQKSEESRDLRTYYLRDGAGRLMSEFRRTRLGTYDPEWTKHYLYLGDRLLGLRENRRPSPPGRLTATTTAGGSVTISWTANPASEAVTSYKVYRTQSSQWTQVCATVNLSCTNAASPESQYRYQVTAVNASGEGYGSDLTILAGDDMPPSAPAGIVARAGDRRIDLTWNPNDPAENVIGYHVYSQIPSGPYNLCALGGGTRVTTVPLTTTSYAELNLDVGQGRCYSVTAVDSVGQESARSADAYAQAGDYAPPSPPMGVTATMDCEIDGLLRVSWNSNALYEFVGAYVIYRTPAFPSCDQGFEMGCGRIVYAIYYDDTSITAGQTYRYEVKALDGGSNLSLTSLPAFIRARDHGNLPQPSPPLVVSAGDGQVVLEYGPPGVAGLPGSKLQLYRKRNTDLDCSQYKYVGEYTGRLTDLDVENGVAYDYAFRFEMQTETQSSQSDFSQPALAIPVARPANVRECMEDIAVAPANGQPGDGEYRFIDGYDEDRWRRIVIRWQDGEQPYFQPHLADGSGSATSYLKGHRIYRYEFPTTMNQYDDPATLQALPIDASKSNCSSPTDAPGSSAECASIQPADPLTGHCDGGAFSTICRLDSDCPSGHYCQALSDAYLVKYGDNRLFTPAAFSTFIHGCDLVTSVSKVYANGNWLTVESAMAGDFDVKPLDPDARCVGIPPLTQYAALGLVSERDRYACPDPWTRPPVPDVPSAVPGPSPGQITVSWQAPKLGICELVTPATCATQESGFICHEPGQFCAQADGWHCRLANPQKCAINSDCPQPAGGAQKCHITEAGALAGYRVYVAEAQPSRFHFLRPQPAVRVSGEFTTYTFSGLADISDEPGSSDQAQMFRFRVATETSSGEVSEPSPATAAIGAAPENAATKAPASVKTIVWTVNDGNGPQDMEGVKIAWKHDDTSPVAGYRVWRSALPEGAYCSLVQLGTPEHLNPPEVETVCLNEKTGVRGSPDAESVSLTTTGTRYFIDHTAVQGRTYYYKVSTVLTAGGESQRSPVVAGSVRPHLTPPLSPPAYFRAWAPEGTSEHQGVYLRWCPNPTVEQVDFYRIYRRPAPYGLTSYTFDLLADNVPPACVSGGVRCQIECPGGTGPCDLSGAPAVLTQTTFCPAGVGGRCKLVDLTMDAPRVGHFASSQPEDRLDERTRHTFEYVVTAVRDGVESAASLPNQGWPKYWQDGSTDASTHRFDPDNFPDFLCGEESSWLDLPGLGPAAIDFEMAPYRMIGIIQNPNEGGGGGGYSPPNASVRFVFFHLDHLGNVRTVTDANGALVSAHLFLPFGEESPVVAQGSASTRLFTGHERDSEAGADYMLARYYVSGHGAFMSVDPSRASIDAKMPSTWNRYAYALNNPLGNIDPDGQFYWGVHRYQTGGLLMRYGSGMWSSTEIGAIAQETARIDLRASTSAIFERSLHFGDQIVLEDLIGKARESYANQDRRAGNRFTAQAAHLAFDLGAHEGTGWAEHGMRKLAGALQHMLGMRNTLDPDSPSSPGFAERYFAGMRMMRDALAKIATGNPHAWGYGTPDGTFVLEVSMPGASMDEARAMGDAYAAKGYTVYIDDVCYKNC